MDKYALENRPCSDCKNIKMDMTGHFCSKLLMAVIPSLLITYDKSKGTCFEINDVLTTTQTQQQ